MGNEARFDRLSATQHPFAESADGYRLAGNWYGPWGVTEVGTPTALIGNVILTVPFLATRGGLVSDIGIGATAAALTSVRLGIYRALPSLYPSTLVADSGDIDALNPGFKSAAIQASLAPGALYWLTYLTLFGGEPTVNTGGAAQPIFGFQNNTNQTRRNGWFLGFSYNPLPATFPTGAVFNDFLPLVSLRFSNVGQA